MTSRKTKWTACLFLILPFVEEIWQALKFMKLGEMEINLWVMIDYPINIQWYVHDAGIYVSNVLQAFIAYRLTAKIQLLHKMAILLLWYRAFQFVMYFVAFDWFPAAVTFAIIFLVSALLFIRAHKDNPNSVINARKN